MADHAPRYPSFESEDGPYEERLEERLTTRSHSVAPYQVGQSGRASYSERSVPLFLSDREGVPDPSEYASSPKKVKLGSYYTSRILAGALGGAVLALLAALVSSDSARQFVASAKASSVAALSVASVVMQPASTGQPKIADVKTADVKTADAKIADVKITDAPIKQAAQAVAPDTQVVAGGTVAMAAVTPTREDIKTAYQSALQGSTPQAAAAPEVAAPADVVHRLDPAEIASLLKRADALIGSGDVAAARLVLRRAAEAADARAAMMLAGTYNPAVLEKLGVHGVVPDLAMARSWYEKARRFGASEASSQLDRLANRQR